MSLYNKFSFEYISELKSLAEVESKYTVVGKKEDEYSVVLVLSDVVNEDVVVSKFVVTAVVFKFTNPEIIFLVLYTHTLYLKFDIYLYLTDFVYNLMSMITLCTFN